MIEYELLYRKKGIRNRLGLLNPPLTPYSQFTFPKNSIWHYMPLSEGDVLPDQSEFTDKQSSYLVELITQYGLHSEYAHRTAVSVASMISDSSRVVRSFASDIEISILRRDPVLVKDKTAVIIESYEPLLKTYRYSQQPLSDYIRWKEIFQTLCSRINQLAKTTTRHHFIMVPLTINLPTLSQFRHAELKVTPTAIKPFMETETLLHLDIMNWVGPSRASSVLNLVDPSAYAKVNLVLFTEDSSGVRQEYTLVNLGLLDSLRKDSSDKDKAVYTPEQYQKVMLKLFNQVVLNGFVAADKVERSEIPEDKDVEISDAESDNTLPEEVVGDVNDDIDENNLDSELSKQELRKVGIATTSKIPELNPSEKPAYVFNAPGLTDKINFSVDSMVKQGVYSVGEANHFKTLGQKYKSLPNPFGEGSLENFTYIDESKLTIAPVKFLDNASVVEKGMLESSLNDFDSRYIRDFLYKDIVAFSLGLQKSGVVISDYSVEPFEDIANQSYRFKMSVQPIPGKPSTLSFEIPKVNKDGVMFSGGVKYFLKKQESELPIRKISPVRVALTSYYGKLFIDKKTTVKNNYERWLLNTLTAIAIDKDDVRIRQYKTGNVLNHHAEIPRAYTLLSKRFIHLNITPVNGPAAGRNLDLHFQYTENTPHVSGMFNVGTAGTNHVLMDKDGRYYITDNASLCVGSLEEMLDINITKAPLEAVVVNIFSKRVSMAIVLGMRMGFSTMIRTLGATYRRVESGKQLNMADHEYRIRFKNESWIFTRNDKKATLILSGLQDYGKSLVKFHSGLFDAKDVYTAVLEESGLTPRYYNEIDTVTDMFIDHVTEQQLAAIHEPVEIMGLLIRAAELLLTDKYPDESDTSFTRIRGYERIGGLVYNQLVQSVRNMNSMPRNKRRVLSLNPMAVKMALITDSAKELYDEINPVHALKQNEIVTLGGTGGRSFDALTKNVRGYHRSSMGTVSESTVDSKNVGAIKYLSSNPMLTTLRGNRATYDKTKNNVVNLLSTSALLAPAVEHDDAKRINYASIQNSHVIQTNGYEVLPLVTGMESIIPQRQQNDIFAWPAEQDGIVTNITKKAMVVTYIDGTVATVEIGKRYGKSKGEVIGHEIIPRYAVGHKFKAREILAYNKGFFTENPILGLSLKTAVLARVTLINVLESYEDSCVITDKLAAKFITPKVNTREISLGFEQHIHRLVTVGQTLTSDDILCYIEDPTTAEAGLLDDDLLETLKNLSRNAPRARHHGKVSKIEIRYRGSLDDMSESVSALAQFHDRQLAKHCAELHRGKITNQVDESFRLGSNQLDKNQMVIIIYIEDQQTAGIGDKGIFGNQAKCTIGSVDHNGIQTADGRDVDALFSISSVNNRKIGSINKMGTTNTMLCLLTEKIINIYKEAKK